MKSPDMSSQKMALDVSYANRLLGLELSSDEMAELLGRMRHGAHAEGDRLSVEVPAYRTDILHPIDLVEDIAIAYGYMNFKPEVPRLYQLGKADEMELFCDRTRQAMIGLGFTEVMSLILTNPRDLFERMNIESQPCVETLKPVSLEQSIARTWILPSLMVVFEKNRNREYPQMIFEVGQAINPSGETVYKACAAIAHSKTAFSEIAAKYTGLLKELKIKNSQHAMSHKSFIPGRCAGDDRGFYGEIHPEVLLNFGLEIPVTAFELTLT
jgi:phenylalanyl-tRNA synthetase beta chain